MNRGPDPRALFPGTIDPEAVKRGKKEKQIIDLEKHIAQLAEKAAYKEDGLYGLPSQNLLSNIFEAARNTKLETTEKRSLRGLNLLTIVKGSIDITPGFIPLTDFRNKPLKSYKINLTSVRNSMGKRVPVVRPEFPEWQAAFDITWNPVTYGLQPALLHQIMERAGDIGICDWHPRFGAYEVVKFDVEEV